MSGTGTLSCLWFLSMKFIDRAFALTITVFLAGACAGAVLVVLSVSARSLVTSMLQSRMLAPLQAVSPFGNFAVFLLVFLNNSVPVVLSFAYPFALCKIAWTPPLTDQRRFIFLISYTFAVAFLVGFFSFGAPLSVAWLAGGAKLSLSLLSGAWIHGPLEFGFVLVCVAEPLRIAWVTLEKSLRMLSDDRVLLLVSIAGLLASAGVEVFLRQ